MGQFEVRLLGPRATYAERHLFGVRRRVLHFTIFACVAALSPCARASVVSRQTAKAPPRMQRSPNAERGGALQIGL